jgi:hypothetical protein
MLFVQCIVSLQQAVSGLVVKRAIIRQEGKQFLFDHVYLKRINLSLFLHHEEIYSNNTWAKASLNFQLGTSIEVIC